MFKSINFTAAINTIKSINSQIKSEYNNQVAILDEAKAQAEAMDQFINYCSTLKPLVFITNTEGLTDLMANDLWYNKDLNDIASYGFNFATIIDDLTLLVNVYKDDIEEHMYYYNEHLGEYDCYYDDYNDCLINFCAALGVDVTPKHHKLHYKTVYYSRHFGSYYDDGVIGYIVKFFAKILNHSDSLYNDTLDEGGYMFDEAFNALNINLFEMGVVGEDDVDYITFKTLVYYAGCLYANGGIC